MMENTINEEEKFEIKTHDFEDSINHLKIFSEQKDSDLEIMKVNGSKGLGEWFAEYFKGGGIGKDHKVTGDELNEVTTQIQNNMIVMNNNQREVKVEFGRVYSALKALDTDYIKALLINMEGIRKTNKKLEDSQEVIKSNQKEINKAQENLKKAHGTLQKTIQQLQKFKEKLDQYKHVTDIDAMWTDIQGYSKEISGYKNKVEELLKFKQTLEKYKHLSDVDQLWGRVDEQKVSIAKVTEDIQALFKSFGEQAETIQALNETRDVILAIEHLSDIDSMWRDISSTDEEINKLSSVVDGLEKSLKQQIARIEILIEKQDSLFKQEHINEVDCLWDNTAQINDKVDDLFKQLGIVDSKIDVLENNVCELFQTKKDIDDLAHFKEIDVMFSSIEQYATEIAELRKTDEAQQVLITNLESKLNEKDEIINKLELSVASKLKIAYFMAGGSLGLAVIELVLILTRMI